MLPAKEIRHLQQRGSVLAVWRFKLSMLTWHLCLQLDRVITKSNSEVDVAQLLHATLCIVVV